MLFFHPQIFFQLGLDFLAGLQATSPGTRISPDEWFSLYASGSHVLSDHHFYTTETAYARPFGVSMETLFKIAEVLDVPVSKLFEV